MTGMAMAAAPMATTGPSSQPDRPVVDAAARTLSIPATAAKQNVYDQLKGAIEYVLVNPGGKEYETLFFTTVDAQAIFDALESLKLRRGKPAGEEAGQAVPPRGDRVTIQVKWTGPDGKPRIDPVESFVLDMKDGGGGGGVMKPTEWVYTSSRRVKDPGSGKEVLDAVMLKNLISLHTIEPGVLIQNAARNASESGRYKTKLDALPKVGTPVTLILTPVEARRIHLRLSGDVQGVGFREFVQRTALGLNVRGWVRNLPSGHVEIVAEGSPEPLASFEAKARKGPRGSRVENVVEVKPVSAEPLGEFEVRPTPG